MKRAKRFQRPLCIMMIDVDRFKTYNDSFGHQEGDELLKAISRALTANLREIDTVCRYGGDEFVVILPESDLPDAVSVANRMRHAVDQLDLKMPVTLSIGVARREEHMDEKGLIQAADKALYKAKQNGRDQVCGG